MYYIDFNPYKTPGHNGYQLNVKIHITDVQFRYRLLTRWGPEAIYIHICSHRPLKYLPYEILNLKIGPLNLEEQKRVLLELDKEMTISFPSLRLRNSFIKKFIKSFSKLEEELLYQR